MAPEFHQTQGSVTQSAMTRGFFPSDFSWFSFSSHLHTTTPEPTSWGRWHRHFELRGLQIQHRCAVEEGGDSAAAQWQIQDASGGVRGWADDSQPERSWCWGVHLWHGGPANHGSSAPERWGFARGRAGLSWHRGKGTGLSNLTAKPCPVPKENHGDLRDERGFRGIRNGSVSLEMGL